MKSNPGGQIDVGDIIGRDVLIESLWSILAEQSVIITAERRIGKTCVIRKMQAQPPPGWTAVLRDLERFHTAFEFASSVFEDVTAHLRQWKKAAKHAQRLLESAGGVEIAGIIKLPDGKTTDWKELLSKSVEDLSREPKADRLVFFWDEMPYMLDNIRRREGDQTAMEVVDLLRSLRHGPAGFRMVLTGSIGLHHVLKHLRDADYGNQPLNDMYSVEVTPLAPEDAVELARRLIRGEGLASTDLEQGARAMAGAGDRFPFYVHHIARHLKMRGLPANPTTIEQCVRDQMLDPHDPWELRHYRERIQLYYPQDDRVALALLDLLSTASDSLGVDDILRAIKSQLAFGDRDRLVDLLRRMERDHYICRDSGGRYRFRFPLLQNYWKLERGLGQ